MTQHDIAHDIVSDILDIAERFRSQHALESALHMLDKMLAVELITNERAKPLLVRAERLVDHFTGADAPLPAVTLHLVFDAEAQTDLGAA